MNDIIERLQKETNAGYIAELSLLFAEAASRIAELEGYAREKQEALIRETQTSESLKAELAAAHQEIAALKGDAERYQHLKANNTWASWLAINYKPNAWDEKIDAAMQGKDE